MDAPPPSACCCLARRKGSGGDRAVRLGVLSLLTAIKFGNETTKQQIATTISAHEFPMKYWCFPNRTKEGMRQCTKVAIITARVGIVPRWCWMDSLIKLLMRSSPGTDPSSSNCNHSSE